MNVTLNKPDAKGAADYFKARSAYTIGSMEVSSMMKENLQDINIVDVRRSDDFRKSHVPTAISLPKDQWETLAGLSKEKTNILYCYSQTCHLAVKAGAFFASKGYPVMEMEGGYESWREHELPIE